jgi:hypothetical protein
MGDVLARGKLGKCTSPLDVLAWLMDEVNEKNGTLMIAYGELIHIHREKDFVDKTNGKYIDDDIDMWAPLETIVHVGELEPKLFSWFGWTIRAFINSEKYVVLLQIMASCGHIPDLRGDKVNLSLPAIEIYPLTVIPKNGSRIAKDLWQNCQFSESMIYPPEHIHFNSTGTSHMLHLHLPHKALDVMTCLYGNWTIPSRAHAGVKSCTDNTLPGILQTLPVNGHMP